eukprot:883163_1
MKIILLILFIRSIFAAQYKITFGKKIYFDDGKVENPISRTIHGTNHTHVPDLIICYEDADKASKAGLCEIGLLDVINQNITFSQEFTYDAPSSDVFETQLGNANGPISNILVGYTSAAEGKQGIGKLAVGSFDLTGNTMKFGAPQQFNDQDNDQTNIIELNRTDSIFAVCYSMGNDDQKGTGCRLGVYDVNSLSVKLGNTFFPLPSNGLTDGMGVSRAIDNGTFVVCYANTNYRIGECVVARAPDLDRYGINAQITYSYPVLFNAEGGTDEIEIHHVYSGSRYGDPNLVICYVSFNDGACSYMVVDMDNPSNPLQLRDRALFAPGDVIDQPTAQVIYPNGDIGNTQQLLMVCYVDVGRETKETAGCVFGEIDINQDKIIFEMQTINNFEFDGADKIDALYLGGNNMIVCYVDGSENANRAPCIFG